MSTSDWPRADPALERFYRRLLHAYPRAYRLQYGAEMVTTLLEMAAPGQRRPAAADIRHLLASGLRQRFRLPARRPLAWIAALLALLAGGALGAAGGSWAGEQTFTDLPSTAQGQQIHQQAAGPTTNLILDVFSGAPQSVPWMWGSSRHADGQVWDGEQARARLAADGWQVGAVRPTDRLKTGTDDPETGFEAVRDGLELTVTGKGGSVTTDLQAVDSGWLLPLIAAGLALGALAGWLIAASVARRRSRPAAIASVFTFAVLFAPVWTLYDNTVTVFQDAVFPLTGDTHTGVPTVHSALQPSLHWWAAGLAGPPESFPGARWLTVGLVVAGLLLAAVTVALSVLRPGRAAAPRKVAT
ncbi:hypothetical protein QLQ12_41345 [Actinoplanes sp. NEAU-A12]|uniref:DUF3533 domain-containing protein n=1 Tax=Actinoplanes sandaracinus TaxID=3045177 RepID=A0ABT6WZN3_9ACTN|nr:hypothetical protein [Actinoplanes sandaracinus]MDI6105050.1 hypothetical protein [Actinoplanes sandaracinus]